MTQDPSTEWHYVDGAVSKGPFTRDQMASLLQARVVGLTTMVWTPGLPAWQPLGQTGLADLLGAMAVAQPPLRPAPADPAAQDRPQPGFRAAIAECFAQYATFRGRANRPTFWYFVLFWLLGSAATYAADAIAFDGIAISPLNGVFYLGTFLPFLAVGTRRLHDTDRTGWWWLAIYVPALGFAAVVPWFDAPPTGAMVLPLLSLLGTFLLIDFWCHAGTQGPNRFG